MTRIDWGVPTTAIYEHGVDRGVFYPRVGMGVPWVGLVAVDEPVTGGTHTPYYYDGIKYYDFVASEDFRADVEAFSAPAAFAACDGTQQLSPGLYATQQRRERFSFSYRTLVADAGDEFGAYKLHLVWNCTALPSPRSYSTMSDVPGAPTRTWTFNTVPPLSSAFKPTAHFVIDSREVHPARLATIEDILYGSASTNPRMPTQTEIIDIFEDPGPIRRTNYIVDPRLTSSPEWTIGSGYTKTMISGGIQIDRAVAAVGAQSALWNATLPPAAEGQKWVSLMQVEVPAGFPALNYTLRLTAIGPTVSISNTSGSIASGQTVNILSVPPTITPASTTNVRMILIFTDPPAGMRALVKRAMLELGKDVPGSWFHGSTTDTESITYEWAGTVDASYSYAKSWDVL